MMKIITLVLLLCATITTFAQQEDTLTVGERSRSYFIHLPSGYNPNGNVVPLVIALHGANQQPYTGITSIASISSFDAKADAENFVVVYPLGLGSDLLNVPTWNAGKCCPPASSARMADVEFISTLIDRLAVRYRIDTRRVYATGISNGGMMCYRLACELSNKIAAIAPVAAAYMVDGTCTPTRPVPVLHVHAKDDPVVPYNGGIGSLSTTLSFPSVDSTLMAWRSIIGCMNTTAQVIFNRSDATAQKWTQCSADAEAHLYVSTTGAHTWTGGFFASQAFKATDIIWNYFRGYSLPVASDVGESSSDNAIMTVTPNPAHDELHIISHRSAPSFSVEIIDMLGRVREHIPTAVYGTVLSVSHLARGVYAVRIRAGESIDMCRVVVE